MSDGIVSLQELGIIEFSTDERRLLERITQFPNGVVLLINGVRYRLTIARERTENE